MDTKEPGALSRRVGRTKYARVRALIEENRRQITAHEEAVRRGAYCPDCRWHTERLYVCCPEQEAIWRAYPSVLAAAPMVEEHTKTCHECQTVEREQTYYQGCTAASRLHYLEQLYTHRLQVLEARGQTVRGRKCKAKESSLPAYQAPDGIC